MIRIATIAFATFGFAAQGADVVVRTGEHGDFTRIFLATPQASSWQVSNLDEGYKIELPHGTDADLTRAFERIGRARIRSISQDNEGLNVFLNCECGTRSFLIENQGLVIDFSEKYPREAGGASVTDREALSGPATPQSPRSLGMLDWKQYRSSRSETSIGLPLEFFDLVGDPAIANPPAKQMLISEIATAATDGVLEPARRIEAHKGEVSVEALNLAAQQIELTRDAFNQRVDQNISVQGLASCTNTHDYAIASWGNPDKIHSAISKARRELIDEAGEVDDAWLRKLVLAQIYAGQGREAMAILASHDTIEDRRVLSSIANLIEGNDLQPNASMSQDELVDSECNASLAMWRALAGYSKGDEEKKLVLTEFSSLPPHLRTTLGPLLIDAYLRQGDLAAARLARTALERINPVATGELREVYAQMHEEIGEVDAAEDIYNDILHTRDANAPESAVKLVDMIAERGGAVPKATTDLIEALSFEYQGTDEGRKLDLAAMKGLIIKGEVSSALELIQNRALDEAEQAAIDAVLLEHFVTVTSTQGLVDLYTQHPQYFLKITKSKAIRAQLGSALASAGFQLQAEKLGATSEVAPRSNTSSSFGLLLANEPEQDDEGIAAAPENLVVRGQSALSDSKSTREGITSLLSQIR